MKLTCTLHLFTLLVIIHRVTAMEESQDTFDFDLEKMQKRLMEAFPDVREFFESQNSSHSDINKKLNTPKLELEDLTCIRKAFRKRNVHDESSTLTIIIKDMITLPAARLYSEENNRGDFEDYIYSFAGTKGGCQNLNELQSRVKSVETFGKCVRLFLNRRCLGWSLAVYPGSERSYKILDHHLREIKSVGPCLTDEFQSASVRPGSKRIIEKNISDSQNYVPDLVEFFSNSKTSDTSLSSKLHYVSHGSATHYVLGPKNRIEFLRAAIYANHYNISQPKFEMQDSAFYKSLDKQQTDKLCYGIPISLGGPTNETYNIFPATPTALERWSEITLHTPPPRDKSWTVLSLNFMYKSETTTRPFAFYYFINNYNEEIVYGRVLN